MRLATGFCVALARASVSLAAAGFCAGRIVATAILGHGDDVGRGGLAEHGDAVLHSELEFISARSCGRGEGMGEGSVDAGWDG